jgi:hypothetical protein
MAPTVTRVDDGWRYKRMKQHTTCALCRACWFHFFLLSHAGRCDIRHVPQLSYLWNEAL